MKENEKCENLLNEIYQAMLKKSPELKKIDRKYKKLFEKAEKDEYEMAYVNVEDDYSDERCKFEDRTDGFREWRIIYDYVIGCENLLDGLSKDERNNKLDELIDTISTTLWEMYLTPKQKEKMDKLTERREHLGDKFCDEDTSDSLYGYLNSIEDYDIFVSDLYEKIPGLNQLDELRDILIGE